MVSRSPFVVCVLALFMFSIQGCYTLNHLGTPTEEAIEITNAGNAPVGSHFERSKSVHHFVYGLVSPDDAGIEELVSDEVRLAKGSKAVNVRIKYEQTFLNGLVGVLTLGLYTPFTLTVKGDVVQ